MNGYQTIWNCYTFCVILDVKLNFKTSLFLYIHAVILQYTTMYQKPRQKITWITAKKTYTKSIEIEVNDLNVISFQNKKT